MHIYQVNIYESKNISQSKDIFAIPNIKLTFVTKLGKYDVIFCIGKSVEKFTDINPEILNLQDGEILLLKPKVVFIKANSDNGFKEGSKIATILKKAKLDEFEGTLSACIYAPECNDEWKANCLEACLLKMYRHETFHEKKPDIAQVEWSLVSDLFKDIEKEMFFGSKGMSDIQSRTHAVIKLSRISSVFITRHLVNMPPNMLRPSDLAKEVLKLEGFGVKVTILEGEAIKNMGGIVAVGQGSSDAPKLIICEWNGDESDPVALVGKGVTFDSGGLCLKPSKSMFDMKCDMAGAATVIGIMHYAALTKMNKKVVGIIPVVENMISGNAFRTGDILTSYSGKTIEVIDTDAEGRLILCDALTYAQKHYNPQCIIDFATLTGAVITALGDRYTGAFSNNDTLFNELDAVSKEVGEQIWRLPIETDGLIKSDIADVKNCGTGGFGAGASSAAEFLSVFVGKNIPWIHFDIAGTAYLHREGVFCHKYASGAMIRTICKWLENKI